MLGRAVVAAAFAASANGILLPPGVNAVDDSFLAISTQAGLHSVRIPCAECAFSTKQEHAAGAEGEVYSTEGGANELLLDFAVSDDNKRLELNGAAIYPPLSWSKDQAVIVHQVSASREDVKVPLRVTSSGLLTDFEQPEGTKEAALVTTRYSVFGVEKQLMQLQDVKIDMLKTGDELLLVKVELDSKDSPAPAFHHGLSGFGPHFGGPPPFGAPLDMTNEKECSMLPSSMCHFKMMLESKIAHLRHKKPCPGHFGPPHGATPSHGARPPLAHMMPHGEHPHPPFGRPHHMRPWHSRPHRHHHHHGHGHRHWADAFARGFFAVLVPVVAGIGVGLGVSLIGLLFSRLIHWLWMSYTRGRAQESDGLAQEELVEEGKGLMLGAEDDDEVPPAYEDAPAYHELDVKVSY